MEFDELNAITATSTGKYRVLAELGSGGMARVYLAVSQGLAGFSKLVVLKVLKSDLAGIPELRDGFLREARLSARMNHPNVVAVNEVEVLDGLPVIVMEHLQGQPLSSILRRVLGRVPLDVHLRILMECLNGLHYAHELADFDGAPLRLVHRDFTPQNIFVTYDGSVKVLDFGVAQVTRGTVHCAADSVQGKLRYMAPEQITTAPLDRRTDVFAAGILLCELVTGHRFWDDRGDATIVRQLKSREIPTPWRTMPNCPVKLAQICAKALAYDRANRYQTIAEMQRDLESYMATYSERITTQEIGRRVAEWFARERVNAQQLIESSLSNDTYVSWSRITATAPGEHGSKTPPPSIATLTVKDLSSTSMATIAVGAAHSRRWLMRLGASAGAVVLLGFGTWLLRGQAPQTSAAATPIVTAPIEPQSITLRITAFPAIATIVLDDIASTENPYIRTVAPNDTWHDLRVEAQGYKLNQQRIQFTRNLELVVALEEETEAPAPPDPQQLQPKTTSSAKRVSPSVQPPSPTRNTRLSCSPPYSYDQRGVKHFKPECL